MIDQAIYERAAKLERYTPTMLKQFAYLLNAKENIRHFSATQFQSLEIKSDGDYAVEASYLNVTVRFQLFLNFQENNPNGRVVCLYKYSLCDKANYDVLGEFNFDLSGRTNLAPNEHGEIRTIEGSSDEIVVGFLNKAIEEGPQAFVRPKI